MKLDMIFMDKKNGIIEINDVKAAIDKISEFRLKIQTLVYKDSSIDCVFRQAEKDKCVYLTLNTNDNEVEDAELLTNIKGILRTNIPFYIVKSYDESSEYYANKLYPLLSAYERKLRKLIYLTIIKLYGSEWVKETMDISMENMPKNKHLKNMSENERIERALEEFAYADYRRYLFEDVNKKVPVNLLSEILDNINDKGYIKKEIRNQMKNVVNDSRCLWTKFFGDVKIVDLDKNIDNVSKFRNKVMHCKEILYYDFVKANEYISQSEADLDEAIFNLENNKYNLNVKYSDILESLHNTLTHMPIIENSAISSLKNAVDMLPPMATVLQDNIIKNSINMPELSAMKIYVNPLADSKIQRDAIYNQEVINSLNSIKNSFDMYSLKTTLDTYNVCKPIFEQSKMLHSLIEPASSILNSIHNTLPDIGVYNQIVEMNLPLQHIQKLADISNRITPVFSTIPKSPFSNIEIGITKNIGLSKFNEIPYTTYKETECREEDDCNIDGKIVDIKDDKEKED